MSRIVTAAAVILALIARPESACAQQRDLKPGVRVRVTAPTIFASRYEAVIGTRRGDTLSLVRGDAQPIDVALSAATRVEVSGGKSRWAGAKRGAMWGVGIGVILAGLNAIVPKEYRMGTTDCNATTCQSSVGKDAAELTIGGAIWGVGIGALIGRERWQQVAPIVQTTGTRDAPAPDGLRLGLRVRF
ncbi:MAG TPA: hypothetical protein VE861_11830 [Gemmatimonadaceae bacterium]|nr:hypothetical protein [Gemmatimonadaceae bacterium]